MSARYNLVKSYYNRGLWDAIRVRSAVDKWITQAEADEILGT